MCCGRFFCRLRRWFGWGSVVIVPVPEEQSPSGTPLRFGVLGETNNLTKVLLTPVAMSVHPISVVCLGGRSYQDTLMFALEHDIPKNGTCDVVISNRGVDAVYISMHDGQQRYAWILSALRAGKHVLVDSPLASTLAGAEILLDTAAKNNLVLMEAVDVLHYPCMMTLRPMLTRQTVGQVRRITVTNHCYIQNDDASRSTELRKLVSHSMYVAMFLVYGKFDRVVTSHVDDDDTSVEAEFILTTATTTKEVSVVIKCTTAQSSCMSAPPSVFVEGEEPGRDVHFVNFTTPNIAHVLWFPKTWTTVQDFGNNDRTSYEHQLDAFYHATQRMKQGSIPTSLIGPPCDDPRNVARAMDAIFAHV